MIMGMTIGMMIKLMNAEVSLVIMAEIVILKVLLTNIIALALKGFSAIIASIILASVCQILV